MYRYETHLHTSPVSKCAVAGVRESLQFYRKNGYDGVFITNHFLDGNINADRRLPYAQRLEFYFSDFDYGKKIASEIGIQVFCGIEISYGGTDFLVYGLDKEWFYRHPEYESLHIRQKLALLHSGGAYIIHAHPFREAGYIDHIRLYPQDIDGVEVINACRTELENRMAGIYAENYGFAVSAGSDNHCGSAQRMLAGIATSAPINSAADFIAAVKQREAKPFLLEAI